MFLTDTTDGTDRGMSVAITHVLTIGITTILIAMLLMGGSAMLDSETEQSAETSLETVGERLAGEIDNVDRIVDDQDDEATIVATHPREVANSGYTVELRKAKDCDDAPLLDNRNPCLELSAHEVDVTVHVPFTVDDDTTIVESSAAGGAIEISIEDDEIEISETSR